MAAAAEALCRRTATANVLLKCSSLNLFYKKKKKRIPFTAYYYIVPGMPVQTIKSSACYTWRITTISFVTIFFALRKQHFIIILRIPVLFFTQLVFQVCRTQYYTGTRQYNVLRQWHIKGICLLTLFNIYYFSQ